MKNIVRIIFLLLIVINCASGKEKDKCNIPKPFFLVKDKNIQNIALSFEDKINNRKGNVSLINFWAIWCKPCREELPFLNTILKREYLDILLVNIGDDKEYIDDFLNTQSIKIPNIYSRSDILKKLNARGLPFFFVINEENVFMALKKINLEKKDSYKSWFFCLSGLEA